MIRSTILLWIGVALSACGPVEAPAPPGGELAERVSESVQPPTAREVFRLEPAAGGGLNATAVVSTPEARAILMAEIARAWPGRTVAAEMSVEAGAPANWVPEAVTLMSFVSEIDDGGLVVVAESGHAGGGVLTLTGRVTDDRALARLAADAAASVAPPFVVRTPVTVGPPPDSAAAADSTDAGPAVVTSDASTAAAAAAMRAALAGATLPFRPGTAILTEDAGEVLDRLAAVLIETPVRVEVAAPGEASGSQSLERALAARRAGAVVDALVQRGVDTSRLRVASTDDEPAVAVEFRVSVGT